MWGTWPTQLVEYVTLDLKIVSSRPTLGIDLSFKKDIYIDVKHIYNLNYSFKI